MKRKETPFSNVQVPVIVTILSSIKIFLLVFFSYFAWVHVDQQIIVLRHRRFITYAFHCFSCSSHIGFVLIAQRRRRDAAESKISLEQDRKLRHDADKAKLVMKLLLLGGSLLSLLFLLPVDFASISCLVDPLYLWCMLTFSLESSLDSFWLFLCLAVCSLLLLLFGWSPPPSCYLVLYQLVRVVRVLSSNSASLSMAKVSRMMIECNTSGSFTTTSSPL